MTKLWRIIAIFTLRAWFPPSELCAAAHWVAAFNGCTQPCGVWCDSSKLAMQDKPTAVLARQEQYQTWIFNPVKYWRIKWRREGWGATRAGGRRQWSIIHYGKVRDWRCDSISSSRIKQMSDLVWPRRLESHKHTRTRRVFVIYSWVLIYVLHIQHKTPAACHK